MLGEELFNVGPRFRFVIAFEDPTAAIEESKLLMGAYSMYSDLTIRETISVLKRKSSRSYEFEMNREDCEA